MKQVIYVIGPGDIPPISASVSRFDDCDAALLSIEHETSDEVILLTPQTLGLVGTDRLRPVESDVCDLVHSGLRFGALGCFRLSGFVSTSWFWLDAPSDKPSTNWRATPDLCLMRPEVVRKLGGFDWTYVTSTARLMDLAYRVLVHGGRVRYVSDWLPPDVITGKEAADIPLVDEFVFILRVNSNGRDLAYFSAVFAVLSLLLSPLKVAVALRRAMLQVRTHNAPRSASRSDLEKTFRLLGHERHQVIDINTISVIIPTINRYEYIGKAIDSILNSAPQILEIIIVDQTPATRRRAQVYAPYENRENVHVIYLDEAGQSIARNVAIQHARGKWLLLFEDDAEAIDTMIDQHVRLLEYSGAVGSTGVSLAPWKSRDDIPSSIRHHHVASVLATGNCLLLKSAVTSIGGLDRAFDHGSGADNDLGLRLYLNGFELIFNHHAIEIHHKAPSGGMRTYGAWWRNRVSGLRAFPAPTFVYTLRKYYPRYVRFAHIVQSYLHARRYGWLYWALLTITIPLRLPLSVYQARKLKAKTTINSIR